jgi:hypothetical protein
VTVLRRLAALPLLALLLAACSAPAPATNQIPSHSPSVAAPSGGFALPTVTPVTSDPNAVIACAGIGLEDAVLHGDANDPARVWLVRGPGAVRSELRWPPGYTAIFNPRLEVVDPSGNVVLREGDRIQGACLADPGALLLEPPFEVASPLPSASILARPSAAAPPSPAAVDCGNVALTECQAVAAQALGQDAATFASVSVGPYQPGCIRAELCAPGRGGYADQDLVIALDSLGARHGWACSVNAAGASCHVAAEADIEPLATLHLQVVGVAGQEVLLLQAGTTWSWTAMANGSSRLLTVGAWQLATSNAACDGCLRITPPFAGTPPPDWCSLAFEAAPSAQITLTVTIRRGAPCQIKLMNG